MPTLSDYQIDYNGVILGPGTAYRINTADGLRSLPELRISDYARLKRHGTYSGIDVLEGRHVTLGLTVLGSTASGFETSLSALEAATVPLLTGSLPMIFKLPSRIQQRVNARCRKRAAPTEPTYGKLFQRITFEFFCGDPRVYDDNLSTTAGTSISITNAGNIEMRPVITVTPSASPVTIINTTTGDQIVLSQWTDAGMVVHTIPNPCVVDTLAGTVVDGSGTNRMDVLDPTTTPGWLDLVPGANAISATNGSVSIAWRSAWA